MSHCFHFHSQFDFMVFLHLIRVSSSPRVEEWKRDKGILAFLISASGGCFNMTLSKQRLWSCACFFQDFGNQPGNISMCWQTAVFLGWHFTALPHPYGYYSFSFHCDYSHSRTVPPYGFELFPWWLLSPVNFTLIGKYKVYPLPSVEIITILFFWSINIGYLSIYLCLQFLSLKFYRFQCSQLVSLVKLTHKYFILLEPMCHYFLYYYF